MPAAEPDRNAPPRPEHLAATAFIDADHPMVRDFARRAVAGADDEPERIRRLFAAVRDEIRYDPYRISADAQDYVASAVIARGTAFCVPKSVLFAAAARALGVPARLGFADVRNHLQSQRLAEVMGTDVFYWHGYSELYAGGQWRKATPAFNAELCARFGVSAIDFDGTADALLHPFDAAGGRYMEYIRDHGAYVDLPLAHFLAEIDAAYPGLVQRAPAVHDPAFAGDEDERSG
jgi:transglutaminase-like putative cysteine protease